MRVAFGRSWRPGKRSASAVLGVFLGFLVWFLFRPGFGNPDTISQVQQIRTGAITDWYAPDLLFLARLLGIRSWNKGFALLCCLMGLSIAAAFPTAWETRKKVTLGAGLVLFPPVLSYVPVLSRDSFFTWLSILLIALAVRVNPKAIYKLPTLLAFAILVLMCRQNGVAVVWLVAMVAVGLWFPSKNLASKVVGATAATLLLVICQFAFRSLVVRPIASHPFQATQYFDLESMSRKSGSVLLPRSVFPEQDLAVLNLYGKSYTGDFLLVERKVVFPASGQNQKDLSSAWRKTIRDNPVLYLRARMHYWSRQIGFGAPPIWIFEPGVPPNELGVEQTSEQVLKRFTEYMNNFAVNNISWGSPIFRSVVYYPVIALLLIRRRRQRLGPDETWQLACCLWAAGLLNELTLLPSAPGSIYRYSYPSIVFYCLGILLAVSSNRGVKLRASNTLP